MTRYHRYPYFRAYTISEPLSARAAALVAASRALQVGCTRGCLESRLCGGRNSAHHQVARLAALQRSPRSPTLRSHVSRRGFPRDSVLGPKPLAGILWIVVYSNYIKIT